MINERDIKAEARLLAIEHALAELYGFYYTIIGATPEQVETGLANVQARLDGDTIPCADPAKADLVTAEFAEAFGALFEKILTATRQQQELIRASKK